MRQALKSRHFEIRVRSRQLVQEMSIEVFFFLCKAIKPTEKKLGWENNPHNPLSFYLL